MRTLPRYILLDLLQAFFITLASLTLFVFLVLIGKEAVQNGLGLGPVVRMLPFMLPQAMQFAVPGALLLAVTSVYGRVSAANEIVAVKSMGISPMKLIWPSVALSLALSLAAVVLNDVAVSWGRGGVQRVVLESLEDIIYGRLKTTGSYGNARLKITVRRLVGRTLVHPTILYYTASNEAPITITADAAKLRVDPQSNAISVSLLNVEADLGGQIVGTIPGWETFTESLEEFMGRGGRRRSPSTYALREIGPTKALQSEKIARLKQEMAVDVGFALLAGRVDEISNDRWRHKVDQLNNAARTWHRLRTEPHRRWANGFSCLGFAMIGAPMAIRRRHGEFWGSFFVCFLPILLVYYPMLVGCVDQAKDGALPPVAVWIGNVVLAAWGVWLMRRVVRY